MFKNLKVRTRLNLILIVASLALLGVGIIGLFSESRNRSEIDQVYFGGVDKIEQLVAVSVTASANLLGPIHRVLSDEISWKDAAQSVSEAEQSLMPTWNDYANSDPLIGTENLPDQHRLVERSKQILKNIQNSLSDLPDILQKQDKQQLANFVNILNPQVDQLLILLNEIILIHVRDTKSDYAEATSTATFYEVLTLICLGLAFAILIPLTLVSIRGIVKPLEYAVECIAASEDIMTSLNHLSTGATETASAVTETTTTVEELKQTANISVDKAKDVLGNAQETLQTVTSSEKSVMATIDDINQIRERMQIISDSILKLSEKSLAIAEIMDSVGDIAEQSNLLAVNAAIESAKAGEVGRSFGVVAQEIRTLAEQSKGATIQVRGLLADIQQATTAAVLATEQGSKAVAKGVDQSTQTSHTIKDLVIKMGKVTQAANQIVLSNQQQLIGTEQITIAMTQISEATNQHVDHLAQIGSAVTTLTQAGSSLKEMTDKYRHMSDGVHQALRIATPKKMGTRQA